MTDYMRKIFYLRAWEQGALTPGAGYIRMVRKKDYLSFSLHVDRDIPKGSSVCGVYREDGQWKYFELGKFLQNSDSWETGIRLTNLPERESGDGIVGVFAGDIRQYWAGEEPGVQLPFEEFFVPCKEEPLRAASEEIKEEGKNETKEESMIPDSQAVEMYPFEDDEMQWCRRIEPEDLMYLSEPCWRMGNNSFLLQGYYSYRHLLYAGNGSRCYIGVPGQYHRRELYLARRFGFPRFKPMRRKRVAMGDFGYWLQDIGGDGNDRR